MANRKSISKSLRFEIFKRDKFQCQYCGASAPDTVLEIDYIEPVSKGGDNDPLNLVTACYECNRGKGAKVLTDNAKLKVQGEELRLLADRREQQQMMLEWMRELKVMNDALIDEVQAIIKAETKGTEFEDYGLTGSGRSDIRKLIDRFSFDEVYASTMISFGRYYDGTDDGWELAFRKIGGVCYNRKIARERSEDA